MFNRIGLAALVAGVSLAAGPVGAAEKDLRIVAVDVEGGTATLFVTPQGRSLLVDTGWPAGMGGARPAPGAAPAPSRSSAEKIVSAAKALGVSRIDYLLLTHYHIDHLGGLPDLLALMPVDAFVDHGPNREPLREGATPQQAASAPASLYPKYEAAIAGKKHVVMAPGDTLKIDDLVLTAVDSDRNVIARLLPGAGKPNPACAGLEEKTADGGEENPRSLGFVASFGRGRVAMLGDTTWNVELKLSCPRTRVGPVDLLLTSHHGSALSNSPALIHDLAPTVAVTSNGATKGGDAEPFDALKAAPTLKDVWQLHFATRSPEKNPPADQIANLAEGPDLNHPLLMRVAKSGAVTVSNPRSGLSKTYPKKR
jgi:beta-lactamase superfamily II metal-dependent hydrolase